MPANIFRAKARAALSGNWPWAILVTFIAGLLLAEGGIRINLINIRYDTGMGPAVGGLFSHLTQILPPLGVLVTLFSQWAVLIIVLRLFISMMLGGVAQVGLCQYNMLLLQKEEQQPLSTLFAPFRYWGRAFALNFFSNLFILLWSLLLVIPGIIAYYSYAMAPYLLAQDPSLDALTAIAASKRMMEGHKWRLFCLHFSFIGWILLSTLTFGIAWLWVSPYICAAEAAFYLDLKEQTPS